MLNNYKKINLKKNVLKKNVFWNIPLQPTSKFQMAETPKTSFLGGLPVVFGQQPLPQKFWWWKKKSKQLKHQKLNFFFSSIVFNSIFLFKKFPKTKKKVFGVFGLKKKLLLINKLFSTKTRYKGYALKPKKGGYFVTSLGFRSFMPKSHSDRLLMNKAPIEWLIGLKLNQRRKRFSAHEKKTLINIVSSSKLQHKGVCLKKGERATGKGPYWQKVASIVNKRIEKEEQKTK